MVGVGGPDKGLVDDLTKEFIAESQEGLERMERCLTELEKRPDDGELVAEIFRSVHTIKGTTGFLGFGRLERLAHAGENLLGALRDGKLAVTPGLISGLLDLMDGLRAILQLIEATGSEGLRLSDDDHELIVRLGELKAGGGELLVVREPTSQKRDLVDPAAGMNPMAEEPTSQKRDPSTGSGQVVGHPAIGGPVVSMQDKTLRIDVEVLNRMMNLVGELVLTRNQILQSTPDAENFPELARRLDSVTAELRESVMQARMQPVGHLFGKFPRMVRDLARTCGRQVRIEFEGQETGLDKSLLEAIRDPLTHAVRNSVDHGIELAEERVKVGKPAEGVVRLRAFHHGGSVVIEVTDDGAGISVARVLAKAVERGLVTAEQASTMTEREALQLVFVAGFSTAKEVTNVSGRGVGMDVVRANVERVGGSVELESHVGLGTTVRLRVPLTLAIVPALVVRSGGQSFALPQNALMELVYVPRRDVETVVERIGTAELYRLRERLLPLVWLDRLLGLDESGAAEALGIYIAVVESEGCRFGLVVDDLMAPEEIVVKPLSAVLREIGVFSGATVLGNGMLAMILDVAATGARAGVRPVVEPAKTVGTGLETDAGEMGRIELESSMVIFEVRTGERMAMPLSVVERIESVPVEEIEFAGGRAVLQYRGEVLLLEDEGDVLRELGVDWSDGAAKARVPAPGEWMPETGASSAAAGDGVAATVLICLRAGAHGMRRMGVVVRRVLDVTAGTLLVEGDEELAGHLAMVRDRVTTVYRESAEQTAGTVVEILREVA
jgi:two-component system, chemotaxis family, sensor kinase CheA